jgi:hypothetical protein
MAQPKRTPDTFQKARTIYLARHKLFDKAAALLDDAPAEVRALVNAHEEIDAQSVLEPDTSDQSQTAPR